MEKIESVEIVLLVAAVAGVLCALLLGVRLAFYRRQIRQFRKRIAFISENDTNLRLTVQYSRKELAALAVSINEVLEKHRSAQLLQRKQSQSFKRSITSISHDLRTPLTSAKGYLQMLSTDGLDARKRAEYIATIASRVESVQRMLEQLFEYARIEANELTLASEPVGLNNILRDVVSLFYDDFCAKDEQPAVYIPDEAFVVRGDADALRRVFTNILHNSLLHGDGAFSIHSERRGGSCVLCFANRTHSVSAGDIEHLFERFYTTDTSRSKKSTGLGLSIAKSLVCRMGGDIRATLSEGVFSVWIEFPLSGVPRGTA